MQESSQTQTFGTYLWNSIKGTAEFMRNLGSKYFNATLIFTLITILVASVIGLALSFMHYGELQGKFNQVGETFSWSYFYASFYVHVGGTGKFLGIVCSSLWGMAILAHSQSNTSEKTTLKSVIESLDSNAWKSFFVAFVVILIINTILYKDLYNIGGFGIGFIETDETQLGQPLVFYQWANDLFSFFKGVLPYLAGVWAFFKWSSTRFKGEMRTFIKPVLVSILICFLLDALLLSILWKLNTLVLTPLGLLFKAEAFSMLFSWVVYLPVLTIFMMLFSSVFIASAENDFDFSNIHQKDEELIFTTD